ncbi:MAG: amidophosphoribosyltransferase [Candidatus Faecivivens sp.]|nr:amidophosphoribosyltransferase [Oscillospiraceae bacterium]MDY2712751.1 amidophosphoribosyltransferase [Candidatus Faecivivens sp.]
MNTERSFEGIHEECGIFGIVTSSDEAAGVTYNALLALQHRGQEGAGIAIQKDGSILYHKDVGLVSEVFNSDVLSRLPKAHMAIGHVRYSTTGTNSQKNTQPMITEYLKGRIATAHNGNIVNAAEIKEKLVNVGCNFAATNDSEVISSLIGWEALRGESIEDAVADAAKQLKGAFSLVVLSSRSKLIAFRDGAGFRPLCLGKNDRGWAVASESCGLDSAGFTFVRDILPGEMVIIDANGNVSSRMVIEGQKKGLCIFEYVYFARTDSVIDGLSVYNARIAMGRQLAREYPVDADIVCGVPDSGLEAAMGYAQESGLPYQLGFVKNRYIGRSFIFPSQEQRDAAVRLKLNPLSVNLTGKRVVVVDDSIVRGTTSYKMIKSLKQAGAKEVHLRISSPPFRHTCHFGTDIDSEENLIANQMDLDAVCRKIGADSLGYISIEGLKKACAGCGLSFCTGCFTGDYPVDIGKSHNKAQFENASAGGVGTF